MTRLLQVLLLAANYRCQCHSHAQQATVFTLQQCLDIAVNNNLNVKQASTLL